MDIPAHSKLDNCSVFYPNLVRFVKLKKYLLFSIKNKSLMSNTPREINSYERIISGV